MFKCCPRPCTGLTSAAIFISAGVVQLISGIILLRSKYVYLLAGPDFWTAAANISVGSLVGVAVSAWKEPKRRKAATYVARFHLLTVLLLSAVIANVTTAAILILGEGNALLSIRLEQDMHDSRSAFASEVLGYAYAASVITPVLCAAVAAISILVGCCPAVNIEKDLETPIKVSKRRTKKILSESDSHLYSWVYSPKCTKSEATRLSKSSCKCLSDSVFDKELEATIPSAASKEMSHKKMPVMSRRKSFDPMYYAKPSCSSFRETISSEPTKVEHPIAHQIVPVKLNQTVPRNFKTGIPVKGPIIPSKAHLSGSWKLQKPAKSNFGTYSVVPRAQPGKVSFIAHDNRDWGIISSFKTNRPKTVYFQEYPAVKSSGSYPKRSSLQRLSQMESISEMPSEELNNNKDNQCLDFSNLTSGYGSSPEMVFSPLKTRRFLPRVSTCNRSILNQEETIPKKPWSKKLKDTTDSSFFHQDIVPAKEFCLP